MGYETNYIRIPVMTGDRKAIFKYGNILINNPRKIVIELTS